MIVASVLYMYNFLAAVALGLRSGPLLWLNLYSETRHIGNTKHTLFWGDTTTIRNGVNLFRFIWAGALTLIPLSLLFPNLVFGNFYGDPSRYCFQRTSVRQHEVVLLQAESSMKTLILAFCANFQK